MNTASLFLDKKTLTQPSSAFTALILILDNGVLLPSVFSAFSFYLPPPLAIFLFTQYPISLLHTTRRFLPSVTISASPIKPKACSSQSAIHNLSTKWQLEQQYMNNNHGIFKSYNCQFLERTDEINVEKRKNRCVLHNYNYITHPQNDSTLVVYIDLDLHLRTALAKFIIVCICITYNLYMYMHYGDVCDLSMTVYAVLLLLLTHVFALRFFVIWPQPQK